MKKFTLIALALMASASSSFAQTVLWDGEDKELGKDNTGVWDRCAPEVVENPAKDNVNSSDKCLKITITGTDWETGDTAFGISGNSFSSKRLSLKIKKDDNSNVRVDLAYKVGNENEYKRVAAWYDGLGEWRTLYFDFSTNGDFDNPTDIAIYPTTDPFEGSKEVYIDDVQIEDLPKVDETTLTDIADGSLKGNVKLYGTWLKGECQNADGNWTKVEFDDFAKFNAKSTDAVTSVDMRGTVAYGTDADQLINKNPNTILYADVAYAHDNVVADGKATNVVLTDSKAFNIPEGFTAENVSITRTVRKGINSFVMPFWVNAEDMNSTSLATFKSSDNSQAVFEKVTSVDANVPFITVDMNASEAGEEKTFDYKDKGFVATGTFDGSFRGVYAPQDANGLYGIDNNGLLHKGGKGATINAFHAYYQVDKDESAPAKISFEGDAPTAINGVAANATATDKAVYDLSGRRVASSLNGASLAKGIYVVGGKKVAVK